MLFKKKRPHQNPPEQTPEKTRSEYSLAYAQIDINKIVALLDSSDSKNMTEADTCQHFILPFFQAFGWNSGHTHWRSQFRIGRSYKHVDYAFSKQGNSWAFIEAKRIGIKNIGQNKNFIRQISGYFNTSPGAHLIILTNGEEYCFYSYGDEENAEICTVPFLRFNIRQIDLTGSARPLCHLFYNDFTLSDWPKYAGMSRALAEIRHALRHAPDSLSKQHIIEKSFALLYPELEETERNEWLMFFTVYS